MQTYFGLLSNGFPNLFFLGLTQVGAAANFVRFVVEQAEFLGETIKSLNERGIDRIEATVEAEQEWCRKMVDQMNAKSAYLANCTPGYYNNEGKIDDQRNPYVGGLYHPGNIYYEQLQEWKDTGNSDAVILTPSP
jgi:hypothetical protein